MTTPPAPDPTPVTQPAATEPAPAPTPAAPALEPAVAGPPPDPAPAAPARDPWKGLRGIMAGTLILEFITVALALPVVAKLGDGLSSAAGWAVGILAVLMLAAAFVQRRPWGLYVALALQAAMIACWPLLPALGILGIIFALVWAYLLHLRHNLTRHLAAQNGKWRVRPWNSGGTLPGVDLDDNEALLDVMEGREPAAQQTTEKGEPAAN